MSLPAAFLFLIIVQAGGTDYHPASGLAAFLHIVDHGLGQRKINKDIKIIDYCIDIGHNLDAQISDTGRLARVIAQHRRIGVLNGGADSDTVGIPADFENGLPHAATCAGDPNPDCLFRHLAPISFLFMCPASRVIAGSIKLKVKSRKCNEPSFFTFHFKLYTFYFVIVSSPQKTFSPRPASCWRGDCVWHCSRSCSLQTLSAAPSVSC